MTVQENLPNPVALDTFAQAIRRVGEAFQAMTPTLRAAIDAQREAIRRVMDPTPEERALRTVWTAVDDSRRLVRVPAPERARIAQEAVQIVRDGLT
jgi:hypothetical protein